MKDISECFGENGFKPNIEGNFGKNQKSHLEKNQEKICECIDCINARKRELLCLVKERRDS